MNEIIDSSDTFTSGTVPIPGQGGDEIAAYLARPLAAEPRGGVVVLHHMPGYDEAHKEITRKFAAHGYLAIMPNLHFRDAPGADPDDAAAANRANGGVPDARLVGDVEAAAAYLRGMPNSNGKVGVIGYCSGGRQAFLAACTVDLDAAVDCYGAFVTAHSPDGFPIAVPPIVGLAPELRCPLLGLFGADDKFPAPGETAELSAVLTELGKEFEFHTYEGAGHAFFSTNRPAYRPEAAVSGWARVFDFFGRHLNTP
ncbi:dienelactone hydrolase family protein [Actinocorallia sp. A-T 12471]|uniref:dienelactone hydrolase family protein n=1 Tax=Actinocorallia sp. A-T 12471 TaxID=3089813 RepID=UPI0029D12C64|nr:dienelactone hydrolase family protein [Actinocorallia sp. A-T 12471]MDX6744953.1 dienelactone hydrolase family protein [Actinocorallia sp. A-T 12471]